MHQGSEDLLFLSFEITRVEDLGADRLVYGELGERFNHCPVVANLPTSITHGALGNGAVHEFAVPREG